MPTHQNTRNLYLPYMHNAPYEILEEIRASRLQYRRIELDASAARAGAVDVNPVQRPPIANHNDLSAHPLQQAPPSHSQDVLVPSQGRDLYYSNSISPSLRSVATTDSQAQLLSSSSSGSTLVDDYSSMSRIELQRSDSSASTDSLNYDRGFRQTCIYEYDRKALPRLPPPTLSMIFQKNRPIIYNTNQSKLELSGKPSQIQTQSKPPVTRWVIFLTWFSPYRQILLGIVLLNFIGVILAATRVWEYPNKDPTALVTANILVAVSIRSEWVLRFIFWVTVKVFKIWPPLKMRALIVGLLYHIGGLHSGCGTSALIWLSWATYHNFYRHAHYNAPILFVMGVIYLCILMICVTALPIIRGPHHNVFELTHRFAGWTSVVFTWIFVVLGSCWNSKRLVWDWSVGHLTQRPEFWCTWFFTILIGAAWVSVEKVPVVCTAPSRKATVVKFAEGLTSGVHARVSLGGLKEWHIFGTVSEGKHSKCHYVVMAVQGNFTTSINRQLPQKLYTRRWKLCGLPYFSRLFRKGVAICTGSGIGAVGSTCLQHNNWFLVWIGGDLEETYGEELCNLIRNGTKDRSLIWDTKKRGRPDVMHLLEDTFASWDAEVALFIGSPKMNDDVLRSCRARQIPAFGSIWDA